MADLIALPTVQLCRIDACTVYLLANLLKVARPLALDALVITSGTDGAHSGPDDPHHHGHAFDLRTHTLPTRAARVQLVADLQAALGQFFFVFLEDPDSANEHVHAQLRRGATWPPPALGLGVPRSA